MRAVAWLAKAGLAGIVMTIMSATHDPGYSNLAAMCMGLDGRQTIFNVLPMIIVTHWFAYSTTGGGQGRTISG